MSYRNLCALLVGLGLAFAQTAFAVDGASIESGYGEGTAMARVNLRWNWDKQWAVGQNWAATAFLESGIGNWRGRRPGGKNLWEIGVTPVFRLNSKQSGFFWEAGIGGHLMSQDRMDNTREFGSHFNFGDLIGFGWRLGNTGRYELGYRFEHLSNANTAMPNGTINFQEIRLGYNF
jgi:lipid A 3-O-deacylase